MKYAALILLLASGGEHHTETIPLAECLADSAGLAAHMASARPAGFEFIVELKSGDATIIGSYCRDVPAQSARKEN